MKKSWLVLMSFVLILGLVLTACGNQQEKNDVSSNPADNYPTRNIEILVGHGAGGGSDLFARAIAKEMEKILGVNIIVINQPGGAGVIAKQNAALAPADGYTLVVFSSFPYTTAAGTNPNGLDKLIPIARVQADTFAVQVRPDRFKNLDEFIAAAKANPGQITIGGTGSMGADEVHAAMFAHMAGIELNYIPIDGAGLMHAELLGGHIDAMIEEIGPAIAYIESGDVIPIVIFNAERLEDFPDVPTTVEYGWDLTTGVERALAIRADAPSEIIAKLESAIKQAMETPTYKEYEKQSFLHLRPGWMGSAEYTAKLEQDIAKFKAVLEELNR